ncbi:MAG: hypothetical protein ACK481_00990 [Candidatus Melainabacteria bacterium]|jgi:hypothetical protein
MILFNKPDIVKVEFDESIPCIVWRPTGFIPSEDFTNSFQAGVNFVRDNRKKQPITKWLNDARKLKGVNPADIMWLDKNANDPAYKPGLERIACILPEDPFARLSIRTYIFMTRKRREIPLQIKTFETIEEARKWLSAP